MSDWSPHRIQPAGQRAAGEVLWNIHVDHVFWRAELFDEQDTASMPGCSAAVNSSHLDALRIEKP